MTSDASRKNVDVATIKSFGDEWGRFDQTALSEEEHRTLFEAYFDSFPWQTLPANAEGFDLGCGSGRWAMLVAPRVGCLNCIDASDAALEVARRNLTGCKNVRFFSATVDEMPLALGSQDFGYSLGVLHHIPDTEAALSSCTALLKGGAPFLLYLYYRFDNRPSWFRAVWRISDFIRAFVSRLPPALKSPVTDAIAIIVYWPLARFSRVLQTLGIPDDYVPLHFYANTSLYTMRTDSRDRFGTPLEQRFTQQEIKAMMERAGLVDIRFSDHEPFWCAVGVKTN